jgi:hypothetical protein
MEINERVHAELQRSGLVSNEEHRIRTLVPRQALTGADRTSAERYEVGDVLRYSRASKETGIGKGAYAQVKSIDAPNNRLTVEQVGGLLLLRLLVIDRRSHEIPRVNGGQNDLLHCRCVVELADAVFGEHPS